MYCVLVFAKVNKKSDIAAVVPKFWQGPQHSTAPTHAGAVLLIIIINHYTFMVRVMGEVFNSLNIF